MAEKQFKDLLENLKIGLNKSNVEIKELLDAKLNEYLDRQDESAEEMVSDIQDALDYVEELIEKMGGGIALASDEAKEPEDTEEINRDLLGQAAKNGKKGAADFVASADMGGQAGTNVQVTGASAAGVNPKGKPWFYSLYGDQKVEDMFEMAESDLNQGDFKHAASVFDMILKIEVANPGAYMGKVMAAHHLKEPKDIATCYDKGLENQPELKRAEGVGNEKQKKFIRDAMEERRKAMIYIEADKTLQMRNNPSELLQAATQFESLGSYRDSSKKADECREASKQVQEAEKIRKEEEQKRQEEAKRRKEEEEKRKSEEKKQQEKKERRKAKVVKLRRIMIVLAGMWLLCAFAESDYFPQVLYKSDGVGDTTSPYYIALRPMEEVVIHKSATNLEYLFMPFGVLDFNCLKPMEKISIPWRAKSVSINCEKLSNLKIPDGVVSLSLYNLTDRLKNLEIPDSVKCLSLSGISDEQIENMILDRKSVV